MGEYSLPIRCIVTNVCVTPKGMILSSFGLKLGVVLKGNCNDGHFKVPVGMENTTFWYEIG